MHERFIYYLIIVIRVGEKWIKERKRFFVKRFALKIFFSAAQEVDRLVAESGRVGEVGGGIVDGAVFINKPPTFFLALVHAFPESYPPKLTPKFTCYTDVAEEG